MARNDERKLNQDITRLLQDPRARQVLNEIASANQDYVLLTREEAVWMVRRPRGHQPPQAMIGAFRAEVQSLGVKGFSAKYDMKKNNVYRLGSYLGVDVKNGTNPADQEI